MLSVWKEVWAGAPLPEIGGNLSAYSLWVLLKFCWGVMKLCGHPALVIFKERPSVTNRFLLAGCRDFLAEELTMKGIRVYFTEVEYWWTKRIFQAPRILPCSHHSSLNRLCMDQLYQMQCFGLVIRFYITAVTNKIISEEEAY